MPPDQHDNPAEEPSATSSPRGPQTPAADTATRPPGVIRAPTTRIRIKPRVVIRIGRNPGNDIQVQDLGVSKHHAELRRSPAGQYQIIDLGSHLGTFVNGTRVDQAELNENDLITIGHATLRLADGELTLTDDTERERPAPPPAPAPPALARVVLHWTDGTTSTVYPPSFPAP